MPLIRTALIGLGTILSAQQMEEPVLRVTVRLVQIDAVVTDKHGNNVPNLTRDDFRLFQDGKEQAITHFSYVEVPGAEAKPPARLKAAEERGLAAKQRSMAPPVPLVREATRRTIALVVDDLGISMQSFPLVKDALRKFVDEQMGAADAAAILRTASSSGVLQQFTNDKRLLHTAIDQVRWSGLGRGGIDAIRAFDENDIRHDGSDDRSKRTRPQSIREFERARAQAYTLGTLGALAHAIEQLREMPGRKSVILFSDGIQLFISPEDVRNGNPVPSRVRELVDLASRAGVVFYTVDARGLHYLGLRASDNTRGGGIQQKLEQRNRDFHEKQEGMAYLARETGGLFYSETNDLAGAARQAVRDQSGYYLLGYSPDEGTFSTLGGGAKYHRLKVQATHPDLRVRTRAGFVGIADKPQRQVPQTPERQLLAAITSAFHSSGIGVRITPLFVSAPSKGTFIHTYLHINGRSLSFREDGEGWRKAQVDVAVAAFAANGSTAAPTAHSFEIRIEPDKIEEAANRGFVLEMLHEAAVPGPYQVRAAVRDAFSGKVGSAGQFLEVPDLRRNQLALSGIEMRCATGGGTDADRPAQGPAVRRFAPDDPIGYSFTVYNPKSSPAATTEIQEHVFRDGKIVWTGRPHPIDPVAIGGRSDFNVARELRFIPDTPEGVYVLRVVARNHSGRKTTESAVQWMDFELRKRARE